MWKLKFKLRTRTTPDTDAASVFFERMEPRILFSADALSGLVSSDPFSDSGSANAVLNISESASFLNEIYTSGTSEPENQIPIANSRSVMLDALKAALDAKDSANDAATSWDTLEVLPDGVGPGEENRQEIIFVDSATPDYQTLLNGIAKVNEYTEYLIVLLQSDQDGIQQIDSVLSQYTNIEAVHLVSHGNSNGVQLGSTWLTNDSLHQYTPTLESWSKVFDTDADFLIYGCNLAADTSGQQLINVLAELTGADVAASDDLTGAKSLGGDWKLEYHSGEIETEIAFSAQSQQNWNATLGNSNPLWLSTDNHVSSGGQPVTGIEDWRKADLVQIVDPNLALGGFTDGSFAIAFDGESFAPGKNVMGVHYVSVDIQLGASGFQLKAGDLLLIGDGTTWTGNSASPDAGFSNSLDGDKQHVLVFRPDTPGDYSVGSFALLLEDPANADLRGITLIEQDTKVGDANLKAGDLLYTRSGGGEEDDIWLYQVTDVGTGTTAGISSVLIEGDEIGIEKLNGIDLVETTTTIGGHTLNAGTVLLTADASVAGTNALAIEKYDVFALDVTATTLVSGAGNAAATASLLFDGSDVGFDSGAEKLDGLTLTVGNNEPPILTTTSATPLSYAILDPPTVIDPLATIADNDSSDLDGGSLTVSISTGVTVNDILSVKPGGNVTQIGLDVLVSGNIIGTIDVFNNGTGGNPLVITWSGVDSTPAAVQEVLRQIAYNNILGLPVTSTRIVDYVLDDGDGGVSDIAQQVINYSGITAPTITLPSAPAIYTENDASAAIIDAGAAIVDSDSADFDAGSLTVAITANSSVNDTLSINTGGNVTLSGSDVLVSGNVIGTIDAVNNGSNGYLVIAWSGFNSTPAAVAEVVRQIAFSNSSENPSGLIRTVTFTLSDGDGGTSLAAEQQVNVNAVNDAPSGTDKTVVTAEETAYTFTSADFGFSDVVDSNTFNAIKINTLPVLGTLTNNAIAVNASDYISVSDIDLGLLLYTPPLDGAGVAFASFDFQVQDTGGIANGGVNLSIANTITLDVTPVNDPPTATNLSSSSAYNEGDPNVAITDIVVSDVDSGETVTATLTLANITTGSLSANDGATYDGLTGIWTITDTVANVNTALANLVFTPVLNNDVDTSIDVNIDDGDEDGSGALTGTITLDVTPVNDPPTATNLSSSSAYNEGDPSVAITDIVVSDVDSGETVTATLTLANITTGSLSANDGATYDGLTGIWTITDTVANVNTALANLVFTPVLNNDVDTSIDVNIDDGDEDGSGALTGTITLDVTPVNDPPTATNLSSSSAYNEGDPSVAITDIVVSDVDSGETVTATLTLANITTGSLSANDGATYDGLTGIWTITDTVANVNTALASLVFTPVLNNDVDTSIDVNIDDGDEDGSGALTGTITLDVTPVNDPPTATNLSSSSAYNEGDPSVAITDIVVSDVDSGETVTATLTLANITTGSLSANDGATYDGLTGIWTITDTVANVNTALANLKFIPVVSNTLDTAIAINIDDGDEDASGPLLGVMTITVNPLPVVNPPVLEPPVVEPPVSDPPPVGPVVEDSGENPVIDVSAVDPEAPVGDPVLIAMSEAPAPALLADSTLELDEQRARDYDNSNANAATISKPTGVDVLLIKLKEQLDFLDDPLQLIRAESFITKLNDMRQELISETEDTEKVIGSSLTVTAGLSVGYVVWLARSGILLSSVLSSLPAWRFIDPLPVLGGVLGGKEGNDQESLESMVEEKSPAEREGGNCED